MTDAAHEQSGEPDEAVPKWLSRTRTFYDVAAALLLAASTFIVHDVPHMLSI
jgi:hypothetical protein